MDQFCTSASGLVFYFNLSKQDVAPSLRKSLKNFLGCEAYSCCSPVRPKMNRDK